MTTLEAILTLLIMPALSFYAGLMFGEILGYIDGRKEIR